ncbi:MAG: tetratricopeptide repeat protein [Acidobacteriota bacterium]
MSEQARHLVDAGIAAAKGGNLEDAEASFRKALELDDTNVVAMFELAGVQLVKRNLENALELMSKAIAAEPGRVKAHYHRGMVRHARGDLQGAIIDFEIELQAHPDDVEAMLSRAVTLSDLGDKKRALADYERLMQMAPNDPRPCVNRALLLAESAPDAAIGDFSEAIRRDPRKADAYIGRGFLFRVKGRRAEALHDFRMFLGLDGPRLYGSEDTVRAWIGELEAETDASGPVSKTPLSDTISKVIASSSSPEALAAFHDAFLNSMVGVTVAGVPSSADSAYEVSSQDNVQIALAGTPDGRRMILACADRIAFSRNFHNRFNAEMRGCDVLAMVLKLPGCDGVLVNSAGSFHSVTIPREEIARLLDPQLGTSSDTNRSNKRRLADTNDERAKLGRPWWKFW